MRYKIESEVSFCHIDNRCVFLNLKKDNYLCISGDINKSFLKNMNKDSLCANDHRNLTILVSQGLLSAKSHGKTSTNPSPCKIIPAYDQFLARPERPDYSLLPCALYDYGTTKIRLKALPIVDIINSIRSKKKRADTKRTGAGYYEYLKASKLIDLLTTSREQCLPRSLSLTKGLMRRGYVPDIVFGVTLDPFFAHCWVQHRGLILNDTLDRVSEFTPILNV